MKYDEAKQTGISVTEFKKLFYRYGMNIDAVTDKAYDFYNESKDHLSAWLKAEIWYCVNHEACTSLADFFIRRTGMIFFYIKLIEPVLDLAADFMAELLGWDYDTKTNYISEFREDLKRATVFE
jgi:glycerol-3-phosphate dehydrogenase